MSKRILAALMAMVLMVSVFAGCKTVTTEEEPIDESSVTAETSSKKPSSSSKASTSSKKPTSSKKATTSKKTQQGTTTIASPTLMDRYLYPDGWFSEPYQIVQVASSDDEEEGKDPGTSAYDNYTEYAAPAETLFQALASRVWRNDGTIWNDIVEQSGNPITLWGYGAYLEAAGAAYAYDTSNSLYKSEYEKALKNVMVYKSSDRVNTGRGAASGTYLALTCWPGGTDAEIFYDDDVWVLKEYLHAYEVLGDQQYLTNADKMLKYILETSWNTDWRNGGLEWMDRLYRGSGSENVQKNTCINAPTMDAALEMYEITGSTNSYLVSEAQKIFAWTNTNLVELYETTDTDGNSVQRAHIYDKLVFNSADDITVDKGELPYNHGMMIAGAARLYKATGDEDYLNYAKIFADSAYDKWLPRSTFNGEDDWGNPWRNCSNPWFNSYLVEGFLTLEECDAETGKKYVDGARNALAITCTYKNYGDGTGWFSSNWASTSAPATKDITVMNQSATARTLFMLALRVNGPQGK